MTASHSIAQNTPAVTPWIDDYAMERVSYQVARLSRSLDLREHDEEDVRQELIAELCSAELRFDPSLASRKTFICRVLTRASAYIARSIRSRRQGYGRPMVSLSALQAARAEQLHASQRDDPAQGVPLSIDLERGLGRLDADQRKLAEDLKTQTPREIAAEAGVHRSTVYRAIAGIREEMSGLGLGAAG
ncbi:sigma-70 RNA polymerase sigma factor region 4 domain-containing protein [Adonisia turfae]